MPRIANFWQVGVLDVVLSEYLNKSHNFTNSIFMTSSHRCSIQLNKPPGELRLFGFFCDNSTCRKTQIFDMSGVESCTHSKYMELCGNLFQRTVFPSVYLRGQPCHVTEFFTREDSSKCLQYFSLHCTWF